MKWDYVEKPLEKCGSTSTAWNMMITKKCHWCLNSNSVDIFCQNIYLLKFLYDIVDNRVLTTITE